jgi:hypothetical protein
MVIEALEAVDSWLQPQTQTKLSNLPQVQESLEAARQVQAQDVETIADGSVQLRQGVAIGRRISIEDPDMRHGRKSRRVRVDGYKRHVLRDLDNGLVRAVGVTSANAPEASVTDA